MSTHEKWNEARGAEIIAEHDRLEGATLVILYAMQETFGYVPGPAIPMIASAVPGIADHIKKFWDPRMRKAIFTHLDSGGTELDPNVRDAIETLKQAA